MKRAILILSLIAGSTFLSQAASADYTCNDRQYLRDILERLEASCGGGSNGSCTAVPGVNGYTYKGSTVDAAIRLCMRDGFSVRTCARDVNCSDDRTICTASPGVNGYSYKGSTLDSAIEFCMADGFSANMCSNNVRCY